MGKEFDALVIDPFIKPGPIEKCLNMNFHPMEGDLAVQRFLFGGDDRNVLQVYVKGHLAKDIAQETVLNIRMN